MASNSNNHNVHPEFDPNLRIKAEPGLDTESSASTSTTSNPSVQNILTNIKVEPGFQVPNNRLPSLFGRRDLTLGGNIKLEKPKRIYTPNVNAQRLKNREDPNATVKNDTGIKKEKVRSRGNNDRERGRDGRGRGRGKAANNLIQSTGVFSEGMADSLSSRRSSSSYSSYRDRDCSGSERESLRRPKLSIPQKVDKAEEAEMIKILLRDDFIADRMDVDDSKAPLSLPMFNTATTATAENSFKVIKSSDIKNEETIKLPNGEVEETNVKPVMSPKTEKEIKPEVTITQLLEKNAKSSNFILLQLPDCLPGIRGVDNNAVAGPSKENRENETEKANNYCILNDLKEGMLGKLQISKSGKAKMLLGDNNLVVDLGSTVSFRQDLIAAKINNEEQELINLGRVNSTLVCALDWEDLIKIL